MDTVKDFIKRVEDDCKSHKCREANLNRFNVDYDQVLHHKVIYEEIMSAPEYIALKAQAETPAEWIKCACCKKSHPENHVHLCIEKAKNEQREAWSKSTLPQEDKPSHIDRAYCLEVELDELVGQILEATDLEGLRETTRLNFPKHRDVEDKPTPKKQHKLSEMWKAWEVDPGDMITCQAIFKTKATALTYANDLSLDRVIAITRADETDFYEGQNLQQEK